MGCDIHDYVEVKKNGRWEKVGAVFPAPYHDPDRSVDVHMCWETGEFFTGYHPSRQEPCNENCYVSNPRFIDHPFDVRSYRTFAVLAGVRNGYGQEYVPIAEPRGLPDDVTPEVVRQSDHYGADGHSHTWLSLGDILRYDWNRTTKCRGWVDSIEYQRWKTEGSPYSWSQGVGGGGVRHVTHEEMDAAIATNDAVSCYTEVEWGETCVESTSRLWDTTIPALLALIVPAAQMPEASTFLEAVRKGDTAAARVLSDWLEDKSLPSLDDIRLVFWFDN